MSLLEYVSSSSVDGIIILHKGEIVFEEYPRMRPYERHIWWSLTKTLVATVCAVLEDRGELDVMLPVEGYLSELKGTDWGAVRLIDVLNMSSGIDCRAEKRDLEDPESCISRLLGLNSGLSKPPPHGMWPDQLSQLKAMQKLRDPGQAFDYTSANTVVLRLIVEKVTGKDFVELVQDESRHEDCRIFGGRYRTDAAMGVHDGH